MTDAPTAGHPCSCESGVFWRTFFSTAWLSRDVTPSALQSLLPQTRVVGVAVTPGVGVGVGVAVDVDVGVGAAV